MSRYICKSCGLTFNTLPPASCPGCGHDSTAIQEETGVQAFSCGQDDENVPVEKMLKDILQDLADRIYDSQYKSDVWEKIIARSIEKMRPLLKEELEVVK